MKKLFDESNLAKAFDDELSNILKKIDEEEVPSNFTTFYNNNKEKEKLIESKIKLNNKIIHQSKLINYFLNKTSLSKIEKETNQPTGWHGCGSIRLALKQEDVDWFHYVKGILDNVGSPAEFVTKEKILLMHPFLKIDDVICGLHTPEDGYTDPTSTTNAMANINPK